MDWTSGLEWWTALAPHRRADDPDRAGMGTAFGLDASLVPWDDEDLDAAPPEPAGPTTWDRRIVRRREL